MCMKVPKDPLHAFTLLYREKHVTVAVLVSRHSGCHLKEVLTGLSGHCSLQCSSSGWFPPVLLLWLAPSSVPPLAPLGLLSSGTSSLIPLLSILQAYSASLMHVLVRTLVLRTCVPCTRSFWKAVTVPWWPLFCLCLCPQRTLVESWI